MQLEAVIEGARYAVDRAAAVPIGIPLHFDGAQPNSYDVPRATSRPYAQDGWIGDVRQGGSCNFETLALTPHCNGTHTECAGHLSRKRLALTDLHRDFLCLARVVTLNPVAGSHTHETYTPDLEADDMVLTSGELAALWPRAPQVEALVVRTYPNDANKKERRYALQAPPFFSSDAMRFIVSRGVSHLLVDFPSVDRTFDEGKLSNHRIFWNVGPGMAAEDSTPEDLRKTISEFIYVPDEAPDGLYLLALAPAPFAADAAPCGPVLFPLRAAQ